MARGDAPHGCWTSQHAHPGEVCRRDRLLARKVNRAMSEPFDPYRKWLGILPKDQPPNHYRLLGIATFESDLDVIDNAANRQMGHVRTFQRSKHAKESQRILTELAAARTCLLTPERKQAYDEQLRMQLAADWKLQRNAPLPPEIGGEADSAALPPLRREDDERWRTGESGVEPPTPQPPPVPIPMAVGTAAPVPVGTPVAPIPTFRRSSTKAAIRARKRRSALPVALIVMSLLILAGGIAALVFSGILNPALTP